MKWKITTTFLVRTLFFYFKFLIFILFLVLLVNGPVNSTQVESSTASSHPNIELSRIGGPGQGDIAGEPVGDPELEQGDEPESDDGGDQEHLTSLESEDMVLTGAVGGGSSSTVGVQGQFRCLCGKECTR